MSFEIRWVDEAKTILLVTYPKEWEWQDFFDFWEGPGTEHLDEADGPVNIISDYNQSKLGAGHLTMLPRVAQMDILNHPNMGTGYDFGGTGMVMQAARIFNKVFMPKNKIVNSLEEALEQIEKNAQT